MTDKPHNLQAINVVPADDDLVERLRGRDRFSGNRLINPDGPAAADRIASLSSELARCRNALTPSAETKAAYMGEFRFDIEVRALDPDEDELVPMTVAVPWTTIKEIMAAIRDRAALNLIGEEGAREP